MVIASGRCGDGRGCLGSPRSVHKASIRGRRGTRGASSMTIAEYLLLPLGNSNGGRHDKLEVAQELYEVEQRVVMRNRREGVVSWRGLKRFCPMTITTLRCVIRLEPWSSDILARDLLFSESQYYQVVFALGSSWAANFASTNEEPLSSITLIIVHGYRPDKNALPSPPSLLQVDTVGPAERP